MNFTNTGGAGGSDSPVSGRDRPDALAVSRHHGRRDRSTPADQSADFRPIARLTAEYLVVAVAADLPYNTLADLVAAIKNRADPVGGSAGGVDHIAVLAQAGDIPWPTSTTFRRLPAPKR